MSDVYYSLSGTWTAYYKAKQFRNLLNRGATNSSIIQQMNDYDDLEYLANVTVGTPEQQFLVVFDTGSADFWIPDSTCKASGRDGGNKVCYGKHLFDSSKSSTYVKNGEPWSIQYGIGYASGFVGQDTVRIGGVGENQLVVPKTTFSQATDMDSQAGRDTYLNGILGLAFASIDRAHADPVLINAMKQGLLDEPIFTVYLKERGDHVNVPGGSITYGSLDTEHCSKHVDYVPLTAEKWYRFKLDAVSYGSFSSSDGWQVISDTGTTAMGVTDEIYEAIIKDLNVDEDGIIDCKDASKVKDMELTIGGKKYLIPAKQLVIHDHGQCLLAVQGGGGGGEVDMVLGDPFIRSYCNVHELKGKKMGFAKVIA